MNPAKTTVSTLAALLVLAGCSAGDGADIPAPDPPTSSTAPSSPAPSSPAPSSPAPSSSPAASDPGSPSPSGVLTLTESCRAVLDDQQGAVTALRAYVRNPLAADVDVADLDRLRSELLAGELSAPEPLRRELNTQVGVLNSAVQGIQDGNVRQVDVGAFQDAAERIRTLCDSAGR